MLDSSFDAYHLRMKQFQLVKHLGLTLKVNKDLEESTYGNDVHILLKRSNKTIQLTCF